MRFIHVTINEEMDYRVIKTDNNNPSQGIERYLAEHDLTWEDISFLSMGPVLTWEDL